MHSLRTALKLSMPFLYSSTPAFAHMSRAVKIYPLSLSSCRLRMVSQHLGIPTGYDVESSLGQTAVGRRDKILYNCCFRNPAATMRSRASPYIRVVLRGEGKGGPESAGVGLSESCFVS